MQRNPFSWRPTVATSLPPPNRYLVNRLHDANWPGAGPFLWCNGGGGGGGGSGPTASWNLPPHINWFTYTIENSTFPTVSHAGSKNVALFLFSIPSIIFERSILDATSYSQLISPQTTLISWTTFGVCSAGMFHNYDSPCRKLPEIP